MNDDPENDLCRYTEPHPRRLDGKSIGGAVALALRAIKAGSNLAARDVSRYHPANDDLDLQVLWLTS